MKERIIRLGYGEYGERYKICPHILIDAYPSSRNVAEYYEHMYLFCKVCNKRIEIVIAVN